MGIPAPLAFPPTALRNISAGLVVGNPVGSSVTRGKALTSAELKAIVEASGISYLPLSGGTLTGNLDLSQSAATLIAGRSSSSYVLTQNGDVQCFSSGSRLIMLGDNALGLSMSSDRTIRWTNSTTNGYATADLILRRGGPGILHQRNNLNAQTFELFETYTSGTNYGSLRCKATSGGHQIGSARGTTGSNRAVQFGHFDASDVFASGLSVATDGIITIPSRLNVPAVYGQTSIALHLSSGQQVATFQQFFGQVKTQLLVDGQLTHLPPAAVTLGINGQFSIEMTSNTAGNLVYRGSDGTTRRMALTFL